MKFSKPRHHSDPSYRRDKVRLGKILEREFGVHVVEVSDDDFRRVLTTATFNSAPFEPNKLGVYYKQAIIVATLDAPMSGFTHEAGHIVASPNGLFHSSELTWFGWELALARRARIPIGEWAYENRDYSLNYEVGGVHLGDVSEVVANPSELWGPFSRQVVAMSRQSSLIDSDGRPLIHPRLRKRKRLTRQQAVDFVAKQLAKPAADKNRWGWHRKSA